MRADGRLTLCSGCPTMWRDVSSATFWYAPKRGGMVTIGGEDLSFLYNSSDNVGMSFSAAGMSDGIYDAFVDKTGAGGTPFLVTGPAWDGVGEFSISGGTVIYDGTGSNGWTNPSAAFDGVTSKPYSSCAYNAPSNSGMANYIGKSWSAPQVASSFQIWPPNNDAMRGDQVAQLPAVFDGYDPVSGTWVNLWTGWVQLFRDPSNNPVFGNPIAIGDLPPIVCTKHRFGMYGNGSNGVKLAQLKIMKAASRTALLGTFDGIAVNAASMTGRKSDGSTYTVAASAATHLGTIQISDGTITADFSCKASPRFGIWNRYNQEDVVLKASRLISSPPPNWYVPGSTYPYWDSLHNDDGNSLTVLTGDYQRVCTELQMNRYLTAYDSGVNSAQHQCGIGWNQKISPNEFWGSKTVEPSQQAALGDSVSASYTSVPYLGSATVYGIEDKGAGGLTKCWIGKRDIVLTAKWKA